MKRWKKEKKIYCQSLHKNEMQMAYKQVGNFSVPTLKKEMKVKYQGDPSLHDSSLTQIF